MGTRSRHARDFLTCFLFWLFRLFWDLCNFWFCPISDCNEHWTVRFIPPLEFSLYLIVYLELRGSYFYYSFTYIISLCFSILISPLEHRIYLNSFFHQHRIHFVYFKLITTPQTFYFICNFERTLINDKNSNKNCYYLTEF